MNVSFRRSRTVPASKPVADPARSTDPRDYQRVGRPLGVMAKTFPAGFVVAEHRHRAGAVDPCPVGRDRTACRSHAMAGPAAARGMDAGGDGARDAGARRGPLAHCLCPAAVLPAGIPRVPRGVMVSPLLRELIVRAAGLPLLYDERGREGRLMAVLLDELEWSREQPLALPDLADRRLGRICQALLENPADPRGLEEWARCVGRPRGPWHGCFFRTGSDLRPLAPPGAPGRRSCHAWRLAKRWRGSPWISATRRPAHSVPCSDA